MSRNLAPLTIQILMGRWMLMLYRLKSNAGLTLWVKSFCWSQSTRNCPRFAEPACHSIFVSDWCSSLSHLPQEVRCKQKAEHTFQASFEEIKCRHEDARKTCFQKAGCVNLLVAYTGLLLTVGSCSQAQLQYYFFFFFFAKLFFTKFKRFRHKKNTKKLQRLYQYLETVKVIWTKKLQEWDTD